MSVVEMQIQVANAYPGWKWKQRVNGMSANQVRAIWFRLKGVGKI
jgi:hypothetical protein